MSYNNCHIFIVLQKEIKCQNELPCIIGWIHRGWSLNRHPQTVYHLCREDGFCKRIARVFAPFRYDFDCRCDLHPRWSRDGKKVCIDSVHEGKRALYVIPIKD